jgi:hypothetical protein
VIRTDPDAVAREWPAAAARSAVPAGEAVGHPVARGFAVMSGLLGGALGLLAVALAWAGDALIPVDSMLLVAGVFSVLAVVAAASAWWRPGVSAVVLAAVVIGFWVLLGSHLGPWIDGYNVAVANPVSEQQYWADAPAMAGFITSAVFLGIASLLAAFGSIGEGER